MNETIISGLAEVGISLTTLAVKGTVSSVSTKVKSIKMEKDIEIVKNKYDEIINEILSEREEAVRIAQLYKSEIDKYQISDDDIIHLHNTVEKVLEVVRSMNPRGAYDGYNELKSLINVDTLKAMQLLGFNYKAAIGEPLTQLCSSVILSKLPKTLRK